jgi:hypothetical protein
VLECNHNNQAFPIRRRRSAGLLASSPLTQAQTIDTRIGKLELDVGCPTKPTADRLYK